jgi:hypothetical protein
VILCHCKSSSEHSEGPQCLHLHVQAVQEHATHHNCSKCQELPAQWSSVNARRLVTWRKAFIAWQCQCIQNVTVGREPRAEMSPEAPSCWRSETGKWEAGSWLNAIAVAELEPDRCPAPRKIHPVCYGSHKQRNMMQWIVWKWSEWRQVGSSVYWTGQGFGSRNVAYLSGEVSLCLYDEFLAYSTSSTCALVVFLKKWA